MNAKIKPTKQNQKKVKALHILSDQLLFLKILELHDVTNDDHTAFIELCLNFSGICPLNLDDRYPIRKNQKLALCLSSINRRLSKAEIKKNLELIHRGTCPRCLRALSTKKIKSHKIRYCKKCQPTWAQAVTNNSHALVLKPGVFKNNNPKVIAKELMISAWQSKTRKTTPYRSAMSMLNFYINRAGKNLSQERKYVLEQAKEELKKLKETSIHALERA